MTREPDPPQPDRTRFEDFYEEHHNIWRHYGYLHAGDLKGGEEIADEIAARLMHSWAQALEQENLAKYAWKLVNDVLFQWLEENGETSKLVDTAAFTRAARTRKPRNGRFEALDESLGLYRAVVMLPPRQFDVTVLHSLMGYKLVEVAEILGITPATARSSFRHACNAIEPIAVKRRLLQVTKEKA